MSIYNKQSKKTDTILKSLTRYNLILSNYILLSLKLCALLTVYLSFDLFRVLFFSFFAIVSLFSAFDCENSNVNFRDSLKTKYELISFYKDQENFDKVV